MILYDKKSNFLGMGQSELSVLGYEDMEEFKSYFDDFADLFVDKPGYISKFKNFSWIDYALHSGAPNKNVLLKHKNGTDIETQLQISEVSLIQEINEESTLYCIELGINTSLSDSPVKQNIKLSDSDSNYAEESTQSTQPQEDTHHHAQDDTETHNNDMHNFDEILVDDFKEDKSDEEDIHLKIPETEQEETEDGQKENESDIVINDNYDLNENIDLESNTLEDEKTQIENEQDIQPTRLKVVFDDEDREEEDAQNKNPSSDFVINSTTPDEDKTDENFEQNIDINNEDIEQSIDITDEDIDLTQIAEDTGMDLGDIAEFMEDFIKESKNYLKELNENNNITDIDFVKSETIKIKGVASNLKITNITKTLNAILENSDKEKLNNLLDLFEKQIKNLEEQLF